MSTKIPNKLPYMHYIQHIMPRNVLSGILIIFVLVVVVNCLCLAGCKKQDNSPNSTPATQADRLTDNSGSHITIPTTTQATDKSNKNRKNHEKSDKNNRKNKRKAKSKSNNDGKNQGNGGGKGKNSLVANDNSLVGPGKHWSDKWLIPSGNKLALVNGLTIKANAHYGRSAVHTDFIEALIVAGKWQSPVTADSTPDNYSVKGVNSGDYTIKDNHGNVYKWQLITADNKGWFTGKQLRGGYVYVPVNMKKDTIMLLHMLSNSMVYVNSEPLTGSRYQTNDTMNEWEPSFDYVRIPVKLHKGRNDLLFFCTRGRLKAELEPIKSHVQFNAYDITAPDLPINKPVKALAAIVVSNNTSQSMTGLYIQAISPDGSSVITRLGHIAPLSVRKCAFNITGASPRQTGDYKVQLKLYINPSHNAQLNTLSNGQLLDETKITLHVVSPYEPQKRTFISTIDNSLQYYAITPLKPLYVANTADNSNIANTSSHTDIANSYTPSAKPALVLTVHGAGVEAINQARAYESKSWCNIVAATNRRPYGFDWEDWGRMDALEVLAAAKKELPYDPHRVYLTGHSMGGHGTWILGSLFPDKFAAIGPSAGWVSFWSYRGSKRPAHPSAIEKIMMRVENISNTTVLAHNLRRLGIYILHGSDDDNVPVTESRDMVKELKTFHHDFIYHEQPGQKHWWDISDEPGADCVDWPAMFDFFARHYLPSDESTRQVEFITANPSVSSRYHWLSIESQIVPLWDSKVTMQFDPGLRRFTGTTDNVSRMSIYLDQLSPDKPFNITLDNQHISNIPWPNNTRNNSNTGLGDDTNRTPRIWLTLKNGTWRITAKASPKLKGPARYGPFKEAFNHNMIFVYGSNGTAQQNRWAFAKARYDAQQWWYQGNGSVPVVSDKEFLTGLVKQKDRSIILYGNADTNTAWPVLLDHSPVQVKNGMITAGGKKLPGDDMACLFLRPRYGSDVACVAAISGTGIKGMRLTDRLSYFWAGCHYPDFVVIGPEMLTQPSITKAAKGIRAAGFFGEDWAVADGDFVWQKNFSHTTGGNDIRIIEQTKTKTKIKANRKVKTKEKKDTIAKQKQAARKKEQQSPSQAELEAQRQAKLKLEAQKKAEQQAKLKRQAQQKAEKEAQHQAKLAAQRQAKLQAKQRAEEKKRLKQQQKLQKQQQQKNANTHKAHSTITTQTTKTLLDPAIGPDPRKLTWPRGYLCHRALGPITIDGKLDEPSWQKAKWTKDFVDIEGPSQPKPKYRTRAKILWDDNYLYVAAQLTEPDIWATITKRNSVIFNDNDFEVFIDPDSDSYNYFEYEMNALNTVWNLFLNKPYKNGGQAKVREMPGQKSAVYINGTLNNPSDKDKYWSVEIAFPWLAMKQYVHGHCPPQDGDYWRIGFSRVEWGHKVVDGKYVRLPWGRNSQGQLKEANWIWSPQGVINMHRPETWGYVQFTTKPFGKGHFEKDPTYPARYYVHKVLYAQKLYYAKHKKYADSLALLGLEKLARKKPRYLVSPIIMHLTPNGFTVTAEIKVTKKQIRKVHINQDAYVWVE